MKSLRLRDCLTTSGPLSQVIFVHDYIQLIFQDCILSLFAEMKVQLDEKKELTRKTSGFCDALVSLIDGIVVSVSEEPNYELTLKFDNDRKVSISLVETPDSGPEILTIANGSEPLEIWRYDD